jgi:hypothetical protein
MLILGFDISICPSSDGPQLSELRKNKTILVAFHAVRRLTSSITDDYFGIHLHFRRR